MYPQSGLIGSREGHIRPCACRSNRIHPRGGRIRPCAYKSSRIQLGDIVPAAQLLEGDPIKIDQSALTEESLPVTKNPP